MICSFIDPFLNYLQWVEYQHLRHRLDAEQVCACISELKFLKICLWWFSRWDRGNCGEENFENLKSMLQILRSRWENLVSVLAETLEEFQVGENRRERTIRIAQVFSSNSREIIEDEEDAAAIITAKGICHERRKITPHIWLPARRMINDWRLWSGHFEGTIEECKQMIRGYCPNLLHFKFNYSFAPSADEILKFLDAILCNLKALARCIGAEIVPLNKKIEAFEEKLMVLRAFFKLIPDDCNMEIRDFRIDLYNDISKVGWLAFFFWGKAGDEEIATELILLLSDMLRKIVKPSLPDVASWYFGALKGMRLQRADDAILLGQAVPGFLDLMFENLRIPFHDDFQILRDGLIILFTFFANPPKEYGHDEEMILIRDQLGDFLCHCPSG